MEEESLKDARHRGGLWEAENVQPVNDLNAGSPYDQSGE